MPPAIRKSSVTPPLLRGGGGGRVAAPGPGGTSGGQPSGFGAGTARTPRGGGRVSSGQLGGQDQSFGRRS